MQGFVIDIHIHIGICDIVWRWVMPLYGVTTIHWNTPKNIIIAITNVGTYSGGLS